MRAKEFISEETLTEDEMAIQLAEIEAGIRPPMTDSKSQIFQYFLREHLREMNELGNDLDHALYLIEQEKQRLRNSGEII